jgi:hypothetical protein
MAVAAKRLDDFIVKRFSRCAMTTGSNSPRSL